MAVQQQHQNNHPHHNGIQLSLEQALAPGGGANSSSGSGSGSTSSTGTSGSSSAADHQPQVGSSSHHQNEHFLNNMRPAPPPPPYINRLNHQHHVPASLPASVRATPTADFELYPRHLRTHSYTQATQPAPPVYQQHYLNVVPQQIFNPVQSTPVHRRTFNNNVVQQQFPLRQLRASDSCNSILSQHQTASVTGQQLLYDKLHGRQSSSSAG